MSAICIIKILLLCFLNRPPRKGRFSSRDRATPPWMGKAFFADTPCAAYLAGLFRFGPWGCFHNDYWRPAWASLVGRPGRGGNFAPRSRCSDPCETRQPAKF